MSGRKQWSVSERQYFAQHVLPLFGPDGKYPDLTPAATIMQKAMARIYPEPRRVYSHVMLYQYYYRKYNPRAVERGEEEREIFPPSTRRLDPFASRGLKRDFQEFVTDYDDEASDQQGRNTVPTRIWMSGYGGHSIIGAATGASSTTRRARTVAPKRGQSIGNQSPSEIHLPAASVAPVFTPNYDIISPSYEDIYKEEESEYALLLANQTHAGALVPSQSVSHTANLDIGNWDHGERIHLGSNNNPSHQTLLTPNNSMKARIESRSESQVLSAVQVSKQLSVLAPIGKIPSYKISKRSQADRTKPKASPTPFKLSLKPTAAKGRMLEAISLPSAALFPASDFPHHEEYDE